MKNSPQGNPRHVERIDSLRGVAILMVVAFHSFVAVFYEDRIDWRGWFLGETEPPEWRLLVLYPLHFGKFGVSLFFVISGFVIHRSFLGNPRFSWSAYFSKRFWRIYPAYAVAMIFFAVDQRILISDTFFLHACLVHNFSATNFFRINPSFWSLAAEAQFYCLYPLALVIRSKIGIRGMLVVSLLASAVWRTIAAINFDWPTPANYWIWWSPMALWFDWLLGAALAEAHHQNRRMFKMPAIWVGFGIVLILAGEVWHPLLSIQFSLGSLVSAVIVETALNKTTIPGRLSKSIAFVGIFSYSFYLIHQPFMRDFNLWIEGQGLIDPLLQVLVGQSIYVVGCMIVSWMMYLIVERGGLRVGSWLTNKFFARQR